MTKITKTIERGGETTTIEADSAEELIRQENILKGKPVEARTEQKAGKVVSIDWNTNEK